MTLTEIEKKLNITYPLLYKTLEQKGMLDVGEAVPDRYRTVYPKLKDNPILLLHSYDFELMNINDVYEAVTELYVPDDYRQINPELKFIPFGQSGGGDLYCFFLSEPESVDIPIVYFYHDFNEACYLAKNLQDFIFRILLNDMSNQDVTNNVSDEEFLSNLKNVLRTHSPYLTEKQTSTLQNMLSRDIRDYDIPLPRGRKITQRGLLTNVEWKEILAEIIPYEKMDVSFEYSDE
ncbi:SMI1/KNR4 family protein [Spirochaeta cellobiosiphila]|uniref:SMI1/KNR4 family protein n=1 Tax=Spirochaeta cellobiosiphila TaxID=504483 RepID=UPI000402EF5E|nr:SMI1/KNR4 family protein [Spirochaeta cellobiosiphila]